jgi:hypothetical protein
MGLTSGAESLTGGGTGETWSWKPLIRAGTLSAGAAGPPVHLRRLTARKAKMIFVASVRTFDANQRAAHVQYSNAKGTTCVNLAE